MSLSLLRTGPMDPWWLGGGCSGGGGPSRWWGPGAMRGPAFDMVVMTADRAGGELLTTGTSAIWGEGGRTMDFRLDDRFWKKGKFNC